MYGPIWYATLSRLFLLVMPLLPATFSLYTRDTPASLAETLLISSSFDGSADEVLYEICAAAKELSSTSMASENHLVDQSSTYKTTYPLSLFASLSDRDMRYTAVPDLFRSIRIGREWDYVKALRALDLVAMCDAVNRYTRSFEIDLYVGPDYRENLFTFKERSKPPERLAPILLEVLSGLASLEELALTMPQYHVEIFKKAFEAANATFPNVRTLVLGPRMEWMIAMCPNVTSVSKNTDSWRRSNGGVDDGLQLINSAAKATSLQHFELVGWLTNELLETVCETMPSIQSLAFPGGFSDGGIEILLPALDCFKNLKTLVLADASRLDVGFDPPWCGNAYMGPGGEQLARKMDEEERQAADKVAQRVFGSVPTLEELWVGDRLRATKKENCEDECFSWSYTARPKPFEDN